MINLDIKLTKQRRSVLRVKTRKSVHIYFYSRLTMLFLPILSPNILSSPYKVFILSNNVLARPCNFLSSKKLIIISFMALLKTLKKTFNRP